MKTCNLLAVLMFLNAAVLAETTERYTITTHAVSVEYITDQTPKNEVEEALFKLDSDAGSVWRYDTNGFARVPDRDLVSPQGYAKQLIKRLDAILIPEINFRGESISNVFAVLQKEILRRDPTIYAGPGHFLRLSGHYGSDASPQTVTFSARRISAMEALKIITGAYGMSYVFRNDYLYIIPAVTEVGQNTFRTYAISPLLSERLHGASFSNVLANLGFNMKVSTVVNYSPELDIVTVEGTYWEHERFQELLFSADLTPARDDAVRFRLVSGKLDGEYLLLLQDGETGQTWRYHATIDEHGKRVEYFDLLLTDVTDLNPTKD